MSQAITAFGPDFPFDYSRWLSHPAGLGRLGESAAGQEIAVIGAGISGLVAAYELMKLGLRPVLYESGRIGGRLRSEEFPNSGGIFAELGGMRFPRSGRALFHYIDLLGLETRAFPNPLTEAAGSTVIDLGGKPLFAHTSEDLPEIFREVERAWQSALESEAHFRQLQSAMRDRDADAVKSLWNPLVIGWDDRTFYDFIATSPAFRKLTFRHREIFGQVGFGTGGWDSDFRNSMLEILRVVLTDFDSDQFLLTAGAEAIPRGIWNRPLIDNAYWPDGTSLIGLHGGATRPAIRRIERCANQSIKLTDQYGVSQQYETVLATCQSWLLTTGVATDESLFSQEHWMALDRTSYMQSSKTFVMVDRPFWKDIDPDTGHPCMSMTLTDRLTRGTYLFDNGPDKPAVICLTYTWMADALKMLPLPVERRVDLALDALQKIYPKLNIRQHIVGHPKTISWEADPNFLGAFKGALPGHYRYNRRMFTHFMQDDMPVSQRGIFIAGDDVSWTPGWAEGAVQTALNAVWGVMHHLGGTTHPENPGPGDQFETLQPIRLDADS